jgi:D-3-phosphoglycerate dehydrogenase
MSSTMSSPPDALPVIANVGSAVKAAVVLAGYNTALKPLPKAQARVLFLEGISQSAVELMQASGYASVMRLTEALDGDALREALAGVHLVGIRSRTRLTEAVFEHAPDLLAVGCFSVGTNQVDLAAARRRGIPVFNAPFSNTRSVAELVIGEIIMLMRRIFPRSVSTHEGGWDKSANDSHEIRGKVLGIVGYGNIGSQLSTMAEAMGMRVLFHDLVDKLRHGNTEAMATLGELLTQSDVVSLHVPETTETRNLIAAAELAAMKPGAYLINNSRGSVVDLEALAASLRSGHLRGAAVDVFPLEPSVNGERFGTPLQGLENVILTPHIGGSTEEAQERIGVEVARKLADYGDSGTSMGAVNFPQVQLPPGRGGARYIHLHRNVPGLLEQVNKVFSRRGLNITGQFLQTDGELGYVLMEAEGPADAGVLAELSELDGTIRTRLLLR